MKRIVSSAIGVVAVGMALPAFAADLPQREYAKAPVALRMGPSLISD